MRFQPAVRIAPPYYNDPVYIEALASTTSAELARLDFKPDVILASFHGVPKAYVDNGDPYYAHCIETMRLLRGALALDESKLMMTFQSRFGRAQWLEPATDRTVKQLAKQRREKHRRHHARLLGRLPRDAGGDRGRERACLQAARRPEFRGAYPASTTARPACR